MNSYVAKLIELALELPPEVRGALANRLSDADAAWEAEIARRLAELDSGAVTTVPWTKARRQILRST